MVRVFQVEYYVFSGVKNFTRDSIDEIADFMELIIKPRRRANEKL